MIMVLENNVSFWQDTETTVKLESPTVHVEGLGPASQTVAPYFAYDGASLVPSGSCVNKTAQFISMVQIHRMAF